MWDYPRPPRLERTTASLRVEHRGVVIAATRQGLRVLETSQPPAFYLPPEDVDQRLLRANPLSTFCEWKGHASYVDVVVEGDVVAEAGWWYPSPTTAFAPLVGHLAFYAQKLDCFVDDEPVDANEGSFYGGWITSRVVGPFKGAPGTSFW